MEKVDKFNLQKHLAFEIVEILLYREASKIMQTIVKALPSNTILHTIHLYVYKYTRCVNQILQHI